MPSLRIEEAGGRVVKFKTSPSSSLTLNSRAASMISRLKHRKRLTTAPKAKSSKPVKSSQSLKPSEFLEAPEPKALQSSSNPPETSEPPEASAQQPLWEQVKTIMDKEKYFKFKSKTLEIDVKRLKEQNNELQQQLKEKDKVIHNHAKKQNRLSSVLQEAKKQLSTQREHGSYGELAKKVEKSAFESRLCRTTLAAAFKLLDDLKGKTTLAELLEASKNQILSGNRMHVRKNNGMGSTDVASSGEDKLLSGRAEGMAMPQMSTKRRGDESDDSSNEPVAKQRKIGGGSPRKIVFDE